MMKPWPGRKWPDVRALVVVFFVGGGLWAFAELADDVTEGDTHAFDTALLLAFREPADRNEPVGPEWMEQVARDITSLGGMTVLTLLTLAIVGFLVLTQKRHAALLVVASVVGGALLSMALKSGFDRPRPDLVPHAVEVASASFPSGHAMLSTVTFLTLGALLARVQMRRRVQVWLIGWAVLLSLLVGASRVYLGVHWPTDVIAGWCIGAAWAMFCASVAVWLQRRGRIEPGTDTPA